MSAPKRGKPPVVGTCAICRMPYHSTYQRKQHEQHAHPAAKAEAA